MTAVRRTSGSTNNQPDTKQLTKSRFGRINALATQLMSAENFSTKLGSERDRNGGACQNKIKVVCNVVNNFF